MGNYGSVFIVSDYKSEWSGLVQCDMEHQAAHCICRTRHKTKKLSSTVHETMRHLRKLLAGMPPPTIYMMYKHNMYTYLYIDYISSSAIFVRIAAFYTRVILY